jgi:LacI family transcriptional regulator
MVSPALTPKRVTINEVAKLANVSIQTVSAVINEKPGITEQTRFRVRQAITQLDYHPNFLASSLRAQKSLTIGVLIPSITNPFFPEFVRGIDDVAQKHGYTLFLCNSDDEERKEINYIQLLRRHRIAGLIAAFQPREPEGKKVLKSLVSHHVPVVLMGSRRSDEKIVTLTVDDVQGAFLATSHLLDLGHRRIGMITPPVGGDVEANRVAGFLKAHKARAIKVDRDLLVPGGFDVSDGQRGVTELLRLRKPPTAIVAANDLVAIGALNALRHLNKRVPEDVAVVGYDNIRMAELFNPPITTIAQPLYRMGESATQAILARINEPDLTGEMIRFETELLIRGSSAGNIKFFPTNTNNQKPVYPNEQSRFPSYR